MQINERIAISKYLLLVMPETISLIIFLLEKMNSEFPSHCPFLIKLDCVLICMDCYLAYIMRVKLFILLFGDDPIFDSCPKTLGLFYP